MQAIYRVQADELDVDFLESIKKMFKHKTLEISIVDETQEDEALVRAIELGLETENVNKDELYKVLSAD